MIWYMGKLDTMVPWRPRKNKNLGEFEDVLRTSNMPVTASCLVRHRFFTWVSSVATDVSI